jgi:hypothetical protein
VHDNVAISVRVIANSRRELSDLHKKIRRIWYRHGLFIYRGEQSKKRKDETDGKSGFEVTQGNYSGEES